MSHKSCVEEEVEEREEEEKKKFFIRFDHSVHSFQDLEERRKEHHPGISVSCAILSWLTC